LLGVERKAGGLTLSISARFNAQHPTPNAQGKNPKGTSVNFDDAGVARLALFPWKLGVGRWALNVFPAFGISRS